MTVCHEPQIGRDLAEAPLDKLPRIRGHRSALGERRDLRLVEYVIDPNDVRRDLDAAAGDLERVTELQAQLARVRQALEA